MRIQRILKDQSPEDKSNPGSSWAREHGCKCPEDVNNHGRGNPTMYDRYWWLDEKCPLHKELL